MVLKCEDGTFDFVFVLSIAACMRMLSVKSMLDASFKICIFLHKYNFFSNLDVSITNLLTLKRFSDLHRFLNNQTLRFFPKTRTMCT